MQVVLSFVQLIESHDEMGHSLVKRAARGMIGQCHIAPLSPKFPSRETLPAWG